MTEEKAGRAERRLESWKEISAYLKRDERTLRRWEKAEGLPVRRHLHESRSSVYAYPSELDAWWAARAPRLEAGPPADTRRLRYALTAAALLLSLVSVGSVVPGANGAHSQQQGPALVEIFAGQDADPLGRFSPDGKLFAGTDWNTGNLVVMDLESGRTTPLTDAGWYAAFPAFAMMAVWSPDGERIAYSWPNRDWQFELRIIARTGGEPKILFTHEKQSFFPTDWSPDGRLIAGIFQETNEPGTVAVMDMEGKLVRLHRLEIRSDATSPRFSPDSRFLAYDAPGRDGHVAYLVELESKSLTRLTQHPAEDRFPVWTPNGDTLLMLSNRSGRWDLWGYATRESRPAGGPRLVFSDVGATNYVNGWHGKRLVFNRQASFGQIYAVMLDPATGARVGEPSQPVQHFVGQHMRALWSPDGKRMALLTSKQRGGSVHVLDMESGAIREYDTKPLNWLTFAGWFPSGDALALSGMTERQRGVYRLKLEGGPPELLMEDPEMMWASGRISGDGGLAVFGRGPTQGEFVVYDLRAKRPVRIVEFDPNTSSGTAILSSDGRALYHRTWDPQSKTTRIARVPLPEGQPRDVVTARKATISSVAVSPDGRWLAYSSSPVTEPAPPGDRILYELYVVAATGGEPKRVKLPPGHRPDRMFWSPDGKQLGYVSMQSQMNFFRLQNFLPAE